jgi:hypothetical protein
MTNFTPELIAKAKTAKTSEELLKLAKTNNVELTEEEAKTCFAQLGLGASGAVTDDELENVAGGFNCGGENESDADTTDSKLNTNIGNEKTNSKYV